MVKVWIFLQALGAYQLSTVNAPSVEINVVIPYDRGDLVHAIHESGEIFSEQYLPEGTSIHARVNGGLAQRIENSHTSGE